MSISACKFFGSVRVIPCRRCKMEEAYQSSEKITENEAPFSAGTSRASPPTFGDIGRLFWLLLQPEQS